MVKKLRTRTTRFVSGVPASVPTACALGLPLTRIAIHTCKTIPAVTSRAITKFQLRAARTLIGVTPLSPGGNTTLGEIGETDYADTRRAALSTPPPPWLSPSLSLRLAARRFAWARSHDDRGRSV